MPENRRRFFLDQALSSFGAMAGVDLIPRIYRGSGPALVDLMGGQTVQGHRVAQEAAELLPLHDYVPKELDMTPDPDCTKRSPSAPGPAGWMPIAVRAPTQ